MSEDTETYDEEWFAARGGYRLEPDDTPTCAAAVPQQNHAAAFRFIDWDAAFAADFSQVDFLPGRFMERGQQVALVGDGKVGKSLLAQAWIGCAATKRPFLGDNDTRPMTVLYFDRENSLRDIVTRFQALGINQNDVKPWLFYCQFPKFSGALNSSLTAAYEFFAVIESCNPDVVVLDTVSRFIEGKENDSDPWLKLYDRIHAELKSRGIACLRLDHFGKDSERGARGNSAKSQDVDHVWELTAKAPRISIDGTTGVHTVETELTMKRSHTRSGVGNDTFHMTRRGQKHEHGLWLPGKTTIEESHSSVALRTHRQAPEAPDRIPHAMEAVSSLLAKSTGALSGREITSAVKGYSTDDKREALARLVTGGYVAESPRTGKGGGLQYQHLTPYKAVN